MINDRIVLIGYTRISQNLITKIEIDFTKNIQIIIGSNGSGKSSLKEQFSPLPPDSADFIKGGRKEWYGRHNGSNYVAISDFGDQAGHYFEKDGEVLNNWGTALVQKALIEREFNLTPQIFEALAGLKKFTEMSPIDRRDWVMFLSRMDISPLMSVFMDAKTKQRDAKGYLTKISERLRLEEKNKIDEAIVLERNNELLTLKDEFNYYSSFSSEVHPLANRVDLQNQKQLLIDFMDQVLENIPKVPALFVQKGIKSIEQLQHYIIENKAKLEGLNQQYQKLMKDLGEINKIAEAKAMFSNQGIDEIQSKINSINAEIANLDEKLSRFDYTIENPKQAKLDFVRTALELRSKLFELPNNQELKFNSNQLNETRIREEGMLHRITRVRETIFKKEHQIKHIDESQEIICPDCHYSFKHGVGKNDRSMLVKEIENLRLEETRLEQGIKEDKEYIQECNAFMEAIRDIYNTMNLTPSNQGLWQVIKAQEFFKNPTFQSIELIDKHYDYLELAVRKADCLELLNKEQDILHKAHESLNIINESNLNSVSKIDEDIFDLRNQIDILKEEVQLAEYTHSRLKHSYQQIGQLREYFDDFHLAYFHKLDEMRAKFINDTKYNIMKEINFIEQELEQARVKNAIFKDVEAELEGAKQTHKEYSIIVDNLSPNTGLIADYMNSSIENFVESFNLFIQSVWTSELKILPCVNKKSDLDWKFPVEVDNGVRRRDVSKTSTSQTDIINFVFQLIIARHLGASEYPMFLDELGSSMDDQHRINMMHVVSDLVETHQCSQMFMISHFAAFHEQFTNNETLVLDAKNIINMPKTYNQHVRIS